MKQNRKRDDILCFLNNTINVFEDDIRDETKYVLQFKTHDELFTLERQNMHFVGILEEFDKREVFVCDYIHENMYGEKVEDLKTDTDVLRKVLLARTNEDVFVYTSTLNFLSKDKVIENALDCYYSLKDETYEKKEIRILKQIKEKIEQENYGEVFETNKKKIFDFQTIKLSNRGDEKRYLNTIEALTGKRRRIEALYPDLTVELFKTNSKGNRRKELFELELSNHREDDFMMKLMKIKGTQLKTHFIVKDESFDYIYDLIEKFMFFEIDGKCIHKSKPRFSITTLSDFLKGGMKAVKML